MSLLSTCMPGERRLSATVRVTDLLVRGPRSITQIAEITGLSRKGIARALRILRDDQRVTMNPATREWRLSQ